MRKQIKMILTFAVFSTVVNVAMADGNAFTPLNFDDTSTAPATTPVATKTANPISNAFSKIMPKSVKSVDSAATSTTGTGEVPIGNDNIQNAILELDNAQVGIRNDLLNYKAKYSDVDAQYKLIKNERTVLGRQVRSIERRIRSIDREKEKIRKNML